MYHVMNAAQGPGTGVGCRVEVLLIAAKLYPPMNSSNKSIEILDSTRIKRSLDQGVVVSGENS
jgi:hypothetical protein